MLSCQSQALPPSPYDGVLPVGASQTEKWNREVKSQKGQKKNVAIALWGCPKMVGFPPKSSILIGISTINHPFWGTTIYGNTHIPHPGAVNEKNTWVIKVAFRFSGAWWPLVSAVMPVIYPILTRWGFLYWLPKKLRIRPRWLFPFSARHFATQKWFEKRSFLTFGFDHSV